jgi:hypothetical protein
MKRFVLLLTVIVSLISPRAQAQGTVTFVASGTSRPIQYDFGSGLTKFPVGSPSMGPDGVLNIGVYAASQGTAISFSSAGPDLSGWLLASPIIHNITAVPGNVVGTTITLDAALGAPGTTVQMIVVGWLGNYSTFQQALFSTDWVAWSGSSASGGALGWTQATGTLTTAQVVNTGPGGFNGLVFVVPEPGTIALGGLGVMMLVLSRWRGFRATRSS